MSNCVLEKVNAQANSVTIGLHEVWWVQGKSVIISGLLSVPYYKISELLSIFYNVLMADITM